MLARYIKEVCGKKLFVTVQDVEISYWVDREGSWVKQTETFKKGTNVLASSTNVQCNRLHQRGRLKV